MGGSCTNKKYCNPFFELCQSNLKESEVWSKQNIKIDPKVLGYLKSNINYIIKVQRFLRKYLSNRQLRRKEKIAFINSKILTERYIENNKDHTIQYENGIKYTGQIFKGMKEGYGSQEWPNGTKYLGFWKENLPQGKGIIFHSNGFGVYV